MGGVPQSFMAAVGALATIFLSLQLCGAEIIYAEKGSSLELPCPCPTCSEKPRKVSWHFTQQSSTITLFYKLENNITRLPAAWDRLEMLQNYSLRISNVTDSDTSRYWCNEHNYYDLVVITGVKQMLESSQADTVCYVLSCSASVKELPSDVASWWEGKEQLQLEDEKGEYSTFSGHRATQLHICLQKGATGRKARERSAKCRIGRTMEIAFSLTGKQQEFCTGSSLPPFPQGTVKDCPSHQCPESGGNGGSWIPMAVCIILQFLIIFALAVALLRRRCRRRHEDHIKELSKDVSKSEYTQQVYENVKT